LPPKSSEINRATKADAAAGNFARGSIDRQASSLHKRQDYTANRTGRYINKEQINAGAAKLMACLEFRCGRINQT
jgi:hypothetical protein